MIQMRHIYTMAAGFLLCAGLASCEMKEEIFGGKDNVPTETGFVALGISVDGRTNVVTRAGATGEGEIQGSAVDPADFPVSFALKDTEYKKEFLYEEIDGKEVELPIGSYTVSAHTPGELKKQMEAPYYGGEASLTVTRGVASDASLTCVMRNSRIVLAYSADFTAKFKDWTVTIDDGSKHALSYTKADGTTPAAVYWLFDDDCSSVKVNIKAVTQAGATVTASRTITKPSNAADSHWTAGDALTINLEPNEETGGGDEGGGGETPSEPSGVQGITISVSAFFETEDKVTVEVPIEDGGTVTPPDTGDGGDENTGGEDSGDTAGLPTISLPNNGEIAFMVKDKEPVDAPASAPVTINAPAKFKSLKVKVAAGNSGFASAIGDEPLYLDKGIDLIHMNEDLAAALGGIIGAIPAEGDNDYTLDLGGFFPLMAPYGSTIGSEDGSVLDAHEFEITVVDQNDKSETKTLKVKISE